MALIVGLIATAALFAAPAVFALDREQTRALVRVAVKLSGLVDWSGCRTALAIAAGLSSAEALAAIARRV